MLQLVNEGALLNCAASRDVVLRMECHIGDFVIAGTPLAAVNGTAADDPEFAAQVMSAFTINRTRTVEQDAAFGFRQIVDVALRALSPSLNDTTTAILCINYLADLLRHAAAREVESPYRRHEGRLRVIATRAKFDDFVHLAFDQLRESGASNAAIVERLLWAIATIGEEVQNATRRQSLVEAAQLIGDSAQREITNPTTRVALGERTRQVVRQIQSNNP